MIEPTIASAFGRRSLSLAMIASDQMAKNVSNDCVADRWRLMRAVVGARAKLALSTGSLTVLEALLTCLPETVMSKDADLVVFPSNDQLSQRCKGMEDRSIRRHLAALVQSGLIVRRDSPNGKRFAVRAHDGAVLEAYGFDLGPLLARSAEIEAMAEEIAAAQRFQDAVRRQVMVLRRYIRQSIELARESEWAGEWSGVAEAFAPLSMPLPRHVTLPVLSALRSNLLGLAQWVDKLLETFNNSQNESGNAGQRDRYQLDSNTDLKTESEPASEETGGKVAPFPPTDRPPSKMPLSLILKACPDILDYAPQGIGTWQDLERTAAFVRGLLGISPSAWAEARAAMGDLDASITIAGLLQRSSEIRSPGGYLRQLTAKAGKGGYTTGPMVMALLKRQSIAA